MYISSILGIHDIQTITAPPHTLVRLELQVTWLMGPQQLMIHHTLATSELVLGDMAKGHELIL